MLNHFIAFVALLFATCSTATASPDAKKPLKIGIILHFSSDLAAQSQAFREGIELAFDVTTAGTEAKNISLIFEDGRNSALASNTAARKLVFEDRVDAVVASSFLDAAVNSPMFEQSRIPSIILWDSSPEIDALGRYTFSIGPWIPSSGEAAAMFAYSRLRARRAVIIKSQDPFSEIAAKIFSEKFEKAGGRVVTNVALPHSLHDFRSVIAKTKALEPDVLYSPVVVDIIPFYKQLREQGFNAPIISCNAITFEHIHQSPAAFEGIYHSMVDGLEGRALQDFEELYVKKFHKPLTFSWFVATGFDALRIILQSAAESDGSREGITSQLERIRNFPGVGRSISINTGGSSPEFEHIYQIRNGKFVRQ